MSTPIEELISACFDELRLSQRFVPYVEQAEAAGYPQLARLFSALVASETARETLLRKGMLYHADAGNHRTDDFFVCPHCGLIYDSELPDQCLVDQTPGEEFIVIQ